MPRFFVSHADFYDRDDRTFVVIRGEDASHVSRALRMRPGERLTVCDPAGVEYKTLIRETGSEVVCEVTGCQPSDHEPPYRATVFQALVKGDRFDTVIQKATELGAARIVPVASARCTTRLDGNEAERKKERWQRIAREAAMQSGRAAIPEIGSPVPFVAAVEEAAEADLPLFCYEGNGTTSLSALLRERRSPESVSVLIGPEGGWSDEEAETAGSSGLLMTGLGRRILRTETAAPFVLACLSLRFELD